MKSSSIRVTVGIVGRKLFPSVPLWKGADVNGRENDRKSAVNGDLLAKSGFGNGGRGGRKLCRIKMEQARYEGKRRGASERVGEKEEVDS